MKAAELSIRRVITLSVQKTGLEVVLRPPEHWNGEHITVDRIVTPKIDFPHDELRLRRRQVRNLQEKSTVKLDAVLDRRF